MNAQLRLPRFRGLVRTLIVTLLAAYVIELLLRWQGIEIARLLALEPGTLQPWQLLTYVVVLGHQEPIWFVFGLVLLWMVLSQFEMAFGAKRTAQLCLACTFAASLAVEVVGFALPDMPLLAGSGSLWLGALVATTYLYADRDMSLVGFFTMTGRQFMLVLLGLTLLNFLFSGNLTAFVADLGAAAAGVAFIRWMRRPRSQPRKGPKRRRASSSDFRVIKGGRSDDDSPPWLN